MKILGNKYKIKCNSTIDNQKWVPQNILDLIQHYGEKKKRKEVEYFLHWPPNTYEFWSMRNL